jgi:hypothetical protein
LGTPLATSTSTSTWSASTPAKALEFTLASNFDQLGRIGPYDRQFVYYSRQLSTLFRKRSRGYAKKFEPLNSAAGASKP